MKLPLDYKIISLGDLKRVVVLMSIGEEAWNEPLEMSREQYGRYKELVFREEPIRFYNGMEIKIYTEPSSQEGGGSVQ